LKKKTRLDLRKLSSEGARGSAMGGGGASSSTAAPAWRDAATAFASASVVVKAVCASLILCYSVYLLAPETVVRGLSVTPVLFWPPNFWVWTAFTHCFLEIHIWEVLLDLVAIILVGKLLEPLWGAVEMVRGHSGSLKKS